MKVMLILITLITSNTVFAWDFKNETTYTSKEKIEKILKRYDSLRENLVIKQLMTGKLSKVTAIKTFDTGDMWDNSGSDCVMVVKAYNGEEELAANVHYYGDEGCQKF